MKIKGWHDFLSGAVFILLGGAALVWLRHLPAGTPSAMGSAAFPNVLGVALGAIGLLLVLRSLRGVVQKMPTVAWRPVLLVSLSIALFALLVLRVGLPVAALIMVLVAGYAGYDKPVRFGVLLLLGVLLAIAATAIFSWALGMPLPVLPR